MEVTVAGAEAIGVTSGFCDKTVVFCAATGDEAAVATGAIALEGAMAVAAALAAALLLLANRRGRWRGREMATGGNEAVEATEDATGGLEAAEGEAGGDACC